MLFTMEGLQLFVSHSIGKLYIQEEEMDISLYGVWARTQTRHNLLILKGKCLGKIKELKTLPMSL